MNQTPTKLASSSRTGRVWAAPTITRLQAGKAEFNNAVTFDGLNNS